MIAGLAGTVAVGEVRRTGARHIDAMRPRRRASVGGLSLRRKLLGIAAAVALCAGLSAAAVAVPMTYDLNSLLYEPPPPDFSRLPSPPAYVPPPVAQPVPVRRPAYVPPPFVAAEPLAGARPTTAGPPATPIGGRAAPRAVRGARFGLEMNARTWFSTGQTDWNHNASGATFGAPLGNPSSRLVYDDLDTLIAEIDGTLTLFEDYFIHANYGADVLDFGDGTFTDTDFLLIDGGSPSLVGRGDVTGLDVWYTTWDAGWTYYRTPDAVLGVFLGYQRWEEEYRVSGFTILECTDAGGTALISGGSCPSLPSTLTSEAVVTNKVEWESFRIGVTADVRVTDKISVTGELAWIPYTDMHNEDSHFLREDGSTCVLPVASIDFPKDLGSSPNIVMDGDGWGWQGETELVYAFAHNWAAFLGFRYWTLSSDGKVSFKCGVGDPESFPLNDLDTVRYGVTAGITYTLGG